MSFWYSEKNAAYGYIYGSRKNAEVMLEVGALTKGRIQRRHLLPSLSSRLDLQVHKMDKTWH